MQSFIRYRIESWKERSIVNFETDLAYIRTDGQDKARDNRTYEPHHDKTNVLRLRPAWIRVRIHAVRLPTLITSRETDSEQHGSWSDCADAQAGLDPCWSQTHYVGFVVTRLIWGYTYSDTVTQQTSGNALSADEKSVSI
jgi:hypothetical protein